MSLKGSESVAGVGVLGEQALSMAPAAITARKLLILDFMEFNIENHACLLASVIFVNVNWLLIRFYGDECVSAKAFRQIPVFALWHGGWSLRLREAWLCRFGSFC